MSSKPRFKYRNPRTKANLNKIKINNEKQIKRELHRNPEFEVKEDLVDERYRLQCDIDQIRKENTQMKKEIAELEKKFTMKEEAKIDYSEKTGQNIDDAFHLKRLLNFSKQLEDLKILQNELEAQYDFLDKFYSETNRNELAATSVYLNNQIDGYSSELSEMNNVIKKANERMTGPVETQKNLFKKQKKRIKLLRKMRNILIIDQEKVEPFNFVKKTVILPEELEAERDELKHKLEILKHRKYNRLKEIEEIKKRREIQKKNFCALIENKNMMEREAAERRDFCMKMKKVQKTNAIIIHNEEEEIWDPFTLAKEAHE